MDREMCCFNLMYKTVIKKSSIELIKLILNSSCHVQLAILPLPYDFHNQQNTCLWSWSHSTLENNMLKANYMLCVPCVVTSNLVAINQLKG